MAYPLKQFPVTILAGQSVSSGVPMGGRLMSIAMPDAWTTASLAFQCAIEQDGPWQDAYDGTGNQVILEGDADQCISVDEYMGANFIRVQSVDSMGDPVAQADERVLTLNMLMQPSPQAN